MRRIGLFAVVVAAVAAGIGGASAQDPARVLHDSLTIQLVYDELPATAIRIDYHAGRGLFYILHRNGDIAVFDPENHTYENVAAGSELGIAQPSGFGIAPDGALFVVGSNHNEPLVRGVLKRAVLQNGSNTPGDWTTVAETVPYPLAANFNHLMSGLLIGPEGRWIYINSGSRTDHGEVQDNLGAHPGVREVPITSAIIKVAADTQGAVIQNDVDSFVSGGFLFADGVRNHFDMAVGPDNRLFGVENSGDRDDGEELNWLREGRHYGFPWRIGTNDTPQQFPGYDPSQDLLINPASSAASLGLFADDPGYPAPPDDVAFTDPIPNAGPDAAEFRGPDGQIRNAPALDLVVNSFTPHKSPLGLVFDTARVLAEPFTGDAFTLGWNQATSDLLGPYDDPGEDLLHLDLEFDSTEVSYHMSVFRIADSFAMPIDAALLDTTLYVMEMRFFGPARIWRIDFPRKRENPMSGTPVERLIEISQNRLVSVYPNPFYDQITARITSDGRAPVELELIDMVGRTVYRQVHRLPAGEREIGIRARGFAPGVYVLRATIGHVTSNRMVTLVR